MRRTIAWGVLVFVILFATAVSVGRILSPLAEDYRPEVEAQISEFLGQPFEIGEMAVVWHGLLPAVDLRDLKLRDPQGRVVIQAAHAYVSPSPTALLQGRLAPGYITLQRPVVGVLVDEEGRIRIRGLDLPRRPDEDGGRWMQDLVLEVRDASVHWINRLQGLDIVLDPLDLRLALDADTLLMSGRAVLPAEVGSELNLAVELRGDWRGARDWSARIHLGAAHLRLAGLPDAALLRQAGLLEGEGSLQLWLGMQAGRLEWAEGSFDLAGVRFAAPDDKAEVSLDAARTRFRWRRHMDGWQVDLAGLVIERNGRQWPETAASLRLGRRAKGVHVRLISEFLRLEDLGALLLTRPELPASVRDSLTAQRLHGDLGDLALDVVLETGRIADYEARFAFRDLGWHETGWIPGFRGLRGRAVVLADRGALWLDTPHVRLALSRMFRAPLDFARLTGELGWRREDSGWMIEGEGFSLANDDVRLSGDFRLELPADGSSPVLELQAEFGDGDASRVADYIPYGILAPRLGEWLSRAFVGGRVPEGQVIFRGPLARFPFHEGEGVFVTRFSVEDGVLDYWNGWPRLEALAGTVEFRNASLDVHARQGRVLGARITQGSARVVDLKHPRLQVNLKTRGSLEEHLRFLRESPLKKGREALLDELRGKGGADLELKLVLPIGARLAQDMTLEGTLALDGNVLELADQRLRFEDLSGVARFTRRSLQVDDARARLFGRPLAIRADTRDGEIRLQGEGTFPVRQLARDLDPWLRRHLSGESRWRAELRIPLAEGGRRARLRLTSDLAGVASRLPAPLAKAVHETWPIEIILPLQGGRDSLQLDVGLEGRMHGRFELRPGHPVKLQRAHLAFGATGAGELPEAGIAVSGHVSRLDLDAWYALAEDRPRAGRGNGLVSLLRRVDLKMDALVIAGRELEHLRLNALRGRGHWKALVESPWLSGSIELAEPFDLRRPLRMELEYLDLDHPDLERLVRQEEDLHPDDLPPLSISLRTLRWQGREFTRVQLGTARRSGEMLIHALVFSGDGFQARLSGSWRAGRQSRTHLDFGIEVTDLGAASRFMRLETGLERGHGRLAGSLSWPGGPTAFAVRPELGGKIEVQLEDGVITGVDPGAGLLLGLFNFDELGRRLRMDFKDLPEEGLGYRRLEGLILVEGSRLRTRELRVESSTAHVLIAGEADLLRRDLSLQMFIVPQVYSATVPLVGAVAGGPLAGVALYLLGKIDGLDQKFNRGTAIEYRITGSWARPKVERVGRETGEDNAEPDADAEETLF